ncbi:hypothetical protein [Lacinutrix sp. WUR7]|uniref:hypothetical protein n=1 Tax=Lacinutrix sp. WUR7 TaxID=2653681 RepID=UPI00351CB139
MVWCSTRGKTPSFICCYPIRIISSWNRKCLCSIIILYTNDSITIQPKTCWFFSYIYFNGISSFI